MVNHLHSLITKLLYNSIAEEIIIGYLLTNNENTKNSLQLLSTHLFYLEKHRIIYLSILNSSHYNNKKIVYAITKELWNHKLLNKIGHTKAILDIYQKSQVLLSYYQNHIYFQYFINILYYYYAKRLFIQYSSYVIQINYINRIHLKEIYEQSIKYLHKISKTIELINNHYTHKTITNILLNKYIKSKLKQEVKIMSGLKYLDHLKQGFQAGELIILAGRPSMGKTSLAINIAYNISIKSNISLYMFSLEMSQQEILEKILALSAKINIGNLQTKKITKNIWNKLENSLKFIDKLKIKIDDTSDNSIEYIKKQSYSSKDKKKLLLSTIYN